VGLAALRRLRKATWRRTKNGDAAAAFSHALAPVEAPSAAAAGLYGEWRGYS
jgi:hypothetical protein